MSSILISAEQIEARLDDLAEELDRDYFSRELLLVCVLKGGVFVFSDLIRRITTPTVIDFMACSSYGSGTTSSGTVRILKDLDTDIEGKHVIVVDDIIDTGLTLDYLIKNLSSRRPASLEVLTLLSKSSRRKVRFNVKYIGFEVPDAFVVGYGLDYDDHYRGLPHIAILKPEIYCRD